jgi:hypothetical protein
MVLGMSLLIDKYNKPVIGFSNAETQSTVIKHWINY